MWLAAGLLLQEDDSSSRKTTEFRTELFVTTAVLSGDQSSVPPRVLAWEQGGFVAPSPVLARQGSPVMGGVGRNTSLAL